MGAIAILFLFVIMMLNIKLVEIFDNTSRYLPVGIFIGLIFLWEIYMTFNKELLEIPSKTEYLDFYTINKLSNIKLLGNLLYENYFIHFFIGALILLVAMLGAIVLTLSHEENLKRQDLFAQISTKHIYTIKNRTC